MQQTSSRTIRTLAAALIAAFPVLPGWTGSASPASDPIPESIVEQHPEREVLMRARADIKGEGITGTAELVEFRAQVWRPDVAEREEYDVGTRHVEITVRATGLEPGPKGLHLHAVGRCEPDFEAAGGHFDPGPFGNTEADANHPYHMGDLPNLMVDDDGEGFVRTVTTRVTLSPGPVSLLDEDGTAIIIHAEPDQGITGPPDSGVSGGPRIACGVISRVD